MKLKTIIVDIDGTLANNAHRQYLVIGEKPNWEQFFSLVSLDLPIEPIVELCKSLQLTNKYKIVLVSGRPERCRQETVKWLNQHEIIFNEFYMRKDGDKRPDYMVKKDILDFIISS